MKKIIVILPSFKAVSPVRAALTIIKNLNTEFAIKVVSLDAEDSSKTDNISFNLKQLDIPYVYLNSHGMSKIFHASKFLPEIVNEEEPDLIISYLLRADIVVSLLKTTATKISSIRNMIEHEYKISHGKIVGSIFGYLHNRALRKFDKLILISQDMKDYFINNHFNKNKLVLIHNFLDEPDVIDKLKDHIVFPFENKFITLVTISSLIKRKNIELLDQGHKFNILIMGDGNQKKDLLNIIYSSKHKDNFVFTGHIGNPLPYLKMSDIFVMASLSEGVSRSLMEALYLGKICIVSDINGNRELIEHEKNGYLFNNDKEFKKLLIKNTTSHFENFLPYSFSYENGIEQTKKLIIEELK